FERRARGPLSRQHVEEVTGQLRIAAVVSVSRCLEAVALNLVRMVVMDGQLLPVPVEGDGAAVADECRAARGGSATGVEVLGIDGVDAGLVLDDGARRVVVAGVDGEATQPVV